MNLKRGIRVLVATCSLLCLVLLFLFIRNAILNDNQHKYYYLIPKNDGCLEQLKSNYTMLNGFFLGKSAPLKDLPQDFEFLINPQNMCYEKVADESLDPLSQKVARRPEDIFIITMIHTSANHFDLRESIRETYGSVKEYFNYKIRLVFVVGTTQDKSIQNHITNESKVHGDIVQASFVDAYRNMTYKLTMGFKWISYYCPHAKFVLKIDDDYYTDIFQVITTLDYFDKTYGPYLIQNIDKIRPKERLLPYINNQTDILPLETFDFVINDLKLRETFMNHAANSLTNDENMNLNSSQDTNCEQKSYTIFDTDPEISREYRELFGNKKRLRDIFFCAIKFNTIVLRTPDSVWYATEEEYVGNYYEPFCVGMVMILTPPTAYKLYKAYFTQPYFFIDDAHVTGKLARMTGTLMIDIQNTIHHQEDTLNLWANEEQLGATNDPPWVTSSKFKYILNGNGANRTSMKTYWNKTLIGHNRYERFFL
ncbi:unnamed protein product [Gordionus sp. m RMFG-2023]